MSEADAIGSLARVLAGSGVPWMLIGGHAVNVWLEPRFTADVDVTVQAGADCVAAVRRALESAGYRSTTEFGAEAASGPDFIRFASPDAISVEVQTAKTAFQQEALERAVRSEGDLRVATAEDLLVMKLIADRPKDQADALGLARLGDLDWAYVERWAREWQVAEALLALRARAGLPPRPGF